MNYIPTDKLIAEIEKALKASELHRGKAVADGSRQTLYWIKDLITSLQQKQPDLPGIEESGIPGKDYIPVEWVDACEKYGKWKIVKQEQPEVLGYDRALLEVKSKVDELYEESSIGLNEYDMGLYNGIAETCMKLRGFIKARIYGEQPEDIVVIAKTFLDALSKTPYNNKPITDAQIIVKQLLLFFENPKEYNPDAILEQPEGGCSEKPNDLLSEPEVDLEKAARNVYESWMGGTMDDVRRDMVELGRVINARKV